MTGLYLFIFFLSLGNTCPVRICLKICNSSSLQSFDTLEGFIYPVTLDSVRILLLPFFP